MKKSVAKVKVSHHRLYACFVCLCLCLPQLASSQYRLMLRGVDLDSASIQQVLKIPTDFKSRSICQDYIQKLPELFQKKGYAVSSIDSVRYDSTFAVLELYVGKRYQWTKLSTDSVEPEILQAIAWDRKSFDNKPLHLRQYELAQQKMLDHMENSGYPFAKVELRDLRIEDESMTASIYLEKGPLYRIDSIRNYGAARISSVFLQRYLNILNGSIYRKERLQKINQRIQELPFLKQSQPWNMTMLGSGSILNLYLEPQRSSQVNVLIGLLPSNAQLQNNKMLVTGEATINLRNALGNGETIALNWQQIQVQSPRLDIAFQQPYLFSSPFGANFNFNLFKKDSSFVNISMLAGVQFSPSAVQSGTLFVQNVTSNVLSVDTFYVKSTRRLPAEIDLRAVSVGLSYQWNATDYRLNPRKGNELRITGSVGTRTIKKNPAIGKLYEPGFDFNSLYDTFQLKSYQFRIRVEGAHFFPLTRVSTLKLGLNGGWIQSPNVFRNELFQIGGYKLLRGFDEESIFASRFAVGTLEYRYLIAQNSYLFSFVDYGAVANSASSSNLKNSFIGGGIGMALETQAGIFNISYAAGKRDDARFNLRQSKIHIGYVNYF